MSVVDAGAAVPPVFRMRDLIRIYKGRDVAVHALPGVDFVVVSAEFVIRPDTSGSGTSTCRKIIDGPDLVSHGSVAFRERNPDCMRVRATRWPYLRRPSPCHARHVTQRFFGDASLPGRGLETEPRLARTWMCHANRRHVSFRMIRVSWRKRGNSPEYRRRAGCAASGFGLSRKVLVNGFGHWLSAIDTSAR